MENQKLEKTLLSDSELSEVSGGASGRFLTTNSKWSSSDDVPKYHEGQRVILQYKVNPGELFNLTCIVKSVTETAECGDYFKEFGYTVKVIDVPERLLALNCQICGATVSGVYESCLKPA